MVQLDLLKNQLSLRTKKVRELAHLWDEVRKKWVRLTPEELVRQLVIQYLLAAGFSARLLQVEKQVLYHGLARRFDLVAYQKELIPFLLVECKSPDITINQKAFDQIAQYNMSLTVPFLWVTNGKTNYCCKMDYDSKSYTFLDHIPVPE